MVSDSIVGNGRSIRGIADGAFVFGAIVVDYVTAG
jgi:hypothetical protein